MTRQPLAPEIEAAMWDVLEQRGFHRGVLAKTELGDDFTSVVRVVYALAVSHTQQAEREALTEHVDALRSLHDDLVNPKHGLSQRLYSRLNSDDIPWGAGGEISAEFCGEIDDVGKALAEAVAALSPATDGSREG